MSGWDQDLLRRIEQAGPVGLTGSETAVEALEARLAWLARAWPGTTRAERVGPAFDDLGPEDQDQLLRQMYETQDHDENEEK